MENLLPLLQGKAKENHIVYQQSYTLCLDTNAIDNFKLKFLRAICSNTLYKGLC